MIIHLDADAFFASVEQAADPKLRGRPVAVGGEKRGIIASASYEARKLGIYTPMPTARARKLCPRLVVVPGDFEKYERFSRFMFSYPYDFTPLVEVASIDEGYFDLGGNRARSAIDVARTIKKAIGEALRISVSEGIGTNKLIAQVASKLKKPSCLIEIQPGDERNFLAPLQNKWLPGVGPVMGRVLDQAGLVRIGQIAEVPPSRLSLFAGGQARALWEFAQGIDDRPVICEPPAAKSYGSQETFERDTADEDFVLAKLRSIADRLFATVRGDGKTVRTVEVRIRYNDFDECRRSESMTEPTDQETDAYAVLRRLLKKAWERRVSLRLVAVKLSGVYGAVFQEELGLLDAGPDATQRRKLSGAVDKLRGKYGSDAVMRGHDLYLRVREEKWLGEETGLTGFSELTKGEELRVRSPSLLKLGVKEVNRVNAVKGSTGTAAKKSGEGKVKYASHTATKSRLKPTPASTKAEVSTGCEGLGAPRSRVSQAPTGLPPIAQGCDEGATLGKRPPTGSSLKGMHPPPTRRRTWAGLNFRSAYSFLDSLLKPEEVVRLAVERGCRAVAIMDPNLHGAVEFYQAAKEAGIRPVIGAEVRIAGGRYCAYVKDAVGYRNLCALLSDRKEGESGNQERWNTRVGGTPNATGGTPEPPGEERGNLRQEIRIKSKIKITKGGRASFLNLDAEHLTLRRGEVCGPYAEGLIFRPAGWQREIRYAAPSEHGMFGILQSIRTLTLVEKRDAAKRRGAFHFPSAEEMGAWDERSVREGLEIADQCGFEFELGGLRFPRYHPEDGSSAHDFLRRLTMEGLRRRYDGKPDMLGRVRSQVEEELGIIAQVGYEEYFLLTWEILQDCKARGIEWITRGSAADSLVCYCLGISDVCPIRFELYFRRFLNVDRMVLNKLPDIDVDFAHDRKDDVVDLIFEKYGEHAAIVGGFNTFQGRSAFAEIAKAMGVSEYQIRRMTEHIPRTSATDVKLAMEQSQECKDSPFGEEPYATALRLAERLDGFPRYPKMHPCGVVLSRVPVRELSPVFTSAKGYPTTHFDMDSVEMIGLVKMDILAQGGLAVMRDTKKLLAGRGVTVDLKGLEPWNDPEVWKMIAAGEARGVHHIESPAMVSLERMVSADNIDDLVAIVSVIRPGAANSMRKVSFARRARGLEPVEYAHPSLEPALRSTYGVVAYEEHILQICEAFAGVSAGRADMLRRALVKCRTAKVLEFREEFASGARGLGRTQEEIARVWELVLGFQGYAFCRAHSTAYGVEAYEAAHLKRYHPAEFLACVLTHGKGFYSRLVYSIECRRLGFGFLSPDINASGPAYFTDYSGEKLSIRVPLGQIKGLSTRTLERWEKGKPYASLRDFYLRVHPSSDEMHGLIRVGAFDGCCGSAANRTAQFWEFRELAQWPHEEGQGILTGAIGEGVELPEVPLVEPSRVDRLKDEMELLGFTVSGHPLDLFPGVGWDTYCPIARLREYPGQRVTVGGMVIEDRIHHQVDGKPMKFLSVCDYTGILECELYADVYQRYGTETIRHPILQVSGMVEVFDGGEGFTLRVLEVGKGRLVGVETGFT